MSPDIAQILTVAIYVLATIAWLIDGWRLSLGYRTIIGSAVLLLAAADRYFRFSFSSSEFVRQIAREQGWYENRRWFQTILVIVIFLGLAASCLAWRFPRLGRRLGFRVSAKTASLMALVSFCLIRVLSNHFIDNLFGIQISGLRIHWIIEWALILLVIYQAARPPPKPARSTDTSRSSSTSV